MIKLVQAIGNFIEDTKLREIGLPFQGDELNLVIDYDENSKIVEELKKELSPLNIPKKKKGGKTFYAEPSGGRSAIIGLDKKLNYKNEEISEIKIKGCRYLDMPPLPMLFTEEKGGISLAEHQTVYDNEGRKRESFINQPTGLLVSFAEKEMLLSNYGLENDVPVNTLPLGIGMYEDVFYVIDKDKHQMGAFVSGLFGSDSRLEEVTLSRRDQSIHNIPGEDAVQIFDNFKNLARELEVDGRTLLFDIIFKGVGKILSKIHSSGMIHGPRQSHLLNYTKPSKSHPIRVCDFGNAEFITNMTKIQAMRYMAYDLGLLTVNSVRFFNSISNSILSLSKNFNYLTDSFYMSSTSLMNESPINYILEGYGSDEISISNIDQNTDIETLFYSIVLNRWDSLFEEIRNKPKNYLGKSS